MEVTILRPQYGYMREVVNMHVLANWLTQKCLHFYPTKTPLESFFVVTGIPWYNSIFRFDCFTFQLRTSWHSQAVNTSRQWMCKMIRGCRITTFLDRRKTEEYALKSTTTNGIFTYIDPQNLAIHVGKYTSPVPWMLWDRAKCTGWNHQPHFRKVFELPMFLHLNHIWSMPFNA